MYYNLFLVKKRERLLKEKLNDYQAKIYCITQLLKRELIKKKTSETKQHLEEIQQKPKTQQQKGARFFSWVLLVFWVSGGVKSSVP